MYVKRSEFRTGYTMLCRPALAISCSILTCAAASIQQLALDEDDALFSSSETRIPSNSTANPSLKGGRDPDFSADFRDHQPELSHGSVYRNFLGLLRELAFKSLSDFMPSKIYSERRYNDVEIAIEALPPLTFATAMWGLEDSLSHMFLQSHFKSCETHLFYNYGPETGPIKIGEIRIRPTASSTSFATNLTKPTNSTEHSTKGTTSANSAVATSSVRRNSLDRPPPHWEVLEKFDGPPLTQDQTIWLACLMIIRMSERRPPYLHSQVGITYRGATLMIQPAQMPETIGPPYFLYEQFIFLVYEVARFMIRQNVYRAGQFVLKIQGEPVGFGEFRVSDRMTNIFNAGIRPKGGKDFQRRRSEFVDHQMAEDDDFLEE